VTFSEVISPGDLAEFVRTIINDVGAEKIWPKDVFTRNDPNIPDAERLPGVKYLLIRRKDRLV
jgi:hypothetical protein